MDDAFSSLFYLDQTKARPQGRHGDKKCWFRAQSPSKQPLHLVMKVKQIAKKSLCGQAVTLCLSRAPQSIDLRSSVCGGLNADPLTCSPWALSPRVQHVGYNGMAEEEMGAFRGDRQVPRAGLTPLHGHRAAWGSSVPSAAKCPHPAPTIPTSPTPCARTTPF